LNAQNARDIWNSDQNFKKELKQIHPLDAAGEKIFDYKV
jgi:hypothetical protein